MQTSPVPRDTATGELAKMPKFQVTVSMRGEEGSLGESLYATGGGDTAQQAFDQCLSLIGEALSQSD